MNNLYRFFTLMALTMAWIMPARAQHPFTLTTQEQHNAHSGETLYWIESKGATGFYMIPMGDGDDSGVSTSNMPNERMLWYFMDAGIENSTQYYYIVNKYTGRFLRLKGDNGADGSIGIKEYVANDIDTYKFSITAGTYQWVIHPYSSSSHTVNKQGTSVNYAKGLKSSTANGTDSSSNWSFVAKDDVAWAHPFDNSTSNVKHYYLIQNRHKDYTSFYMSTDASSYVTVSTVGDNNRIWYFEEASSDAQIPNMKYYYIVNAVTGKYMYFDGNTISGISQLDDVFKIQDHSGGDDDRYQFAIVNAVGKTYSAYAIMPKKLISLYNDKYTSLGSGTMNDGERIDTRKDRGSDDNTAHWVFTTTTYSAVVAPTITNNFDGTITLNTTTTGATIYYTTNGDEPDNNSTEYTLPFALGDATVIKAVAYLGTNFAIAPPYNVPTYTTPTISFDDNTSLITIASEGTVYYNTGDGSQAAPTPSSGTLYTAPFELSSATFVKAIATHPGYLTSDVATWPTDPEHDYSADYLTFKILTDGTICWKAFGSGYTRTIEYSKNNGSWTSITSTSEGVTIDVIANDVVRFRGNNTTYAGSKSNYSGFEGGTAFFDIEGNIHSLLYGDSFANGNNNSLTNTTYQFCSLFKNSLVVSAENLILPALTLTEDCYRAMFSLCTTLEKAPALPATTLAKECYWYMFECCAITTAPVLLATTLVNSCYAHMFVGCSNLNYIKCMATSGINGSNLANWVGEKNSETTLGVAGTGTFVKDNDADWSALSGTSGIPSGWDVYNFGAPKDPEINCDGEYITITCVTEGASIYYRLSQTDEFSLYSDQIAFVETTTVEAYSLKDDYTSNHVIVTFEKFANPFEESTRPVNSWTFGNTQVTLPYSVNGIDGHSSSYSKGTHAFETIITLYKQQPTYLWFQHADQSADIYVDNTFVTTHWGGYNAFFVNITDYVHVGTNRIKVVLNNKTRNILAPCAGDFNFNATLGKVKLLTSPVVPSMDYGYDGFHITATDVSSSAATLTIKTKVPLGATLICKIDDEGSYYHYSSTEPSTGEDQTFTTTIENPILWNGTINPHLYTVTLEIYKDDELYHRYQRPYGIRYYDYVIDENGYTGFRLNGSPYLLRGVCMHDDLEGKANALNDDDYAQEFAIIQELGCNFIRLAHYPHPKEVYDWCDRLGIIVQTEVPCVNTLHSTLPNDYYTHLTIQYKDMVNQHYNHPCIMFWGLSNETTTDDKDFAKEKIEEYASLIKGLDSERLVGYVMSHSVDDPSGYYLDPDPDPYQIDWFGCNIYVGWYIDKTSNNPTSRLTTRLEKTLDRLGKPLAFSEYGCGGTQHCHSEDPWTTTTKGTSTPDNECDRHDIEYLMWLHEGHIAAIKNKPELLFTSQWQLFDIAVYNRHEGYKICLDGETTFDNNELKYLNNKGLVERDHKTKKDPFYLYKAWWNPTDKFVHICGKDYKKLNSRVIKCYTNDNGPFKLYVNNVLKDTKSASDYIVLFDEQIFQPGDIIRVDGANSNDTFTFTNYNNNNVFKTAGNWNVDDNWSGNAVPVDGSDVVLIANATVPSGYTANANNIDLYGGAITIADGGQLVSNSAVNATVEKNIAAYTIVQNHDEYLTDAWYFIASPITDDYTPTGNMLANTYDLYRLNNTTWENFKNTTEHPDFTTLNNGTGYLYANSNNVTLSFTGAIKPYDATYTVGEGTGWNLVGNPYTFNAYVNQSHYTMNDNRDAIIAATSNSAEIAPCTGVIVEGNATFYKEALSQSNNNGYIQLALTQQATNRGTATTLDNAIVSFNEDDQLGKFYFGTQNANIYIPQNGKEFAIVSVGSDAMHCVATEIPINFKANENGEYTLTISSPFTSHLSPFTYLQLIDNLTGADIDLLATPSYTFTAKTTDYESRFRLVFNANDNENDNENDNFAFVHNGEIIVETPWYDVSTIQVIDILGHVILTREVTPHSSLLTPNSSLSPGVYVLRLIQGENVKTQKIVIE